MRDFKFAVGVDLGQARDYTAIAIVEPVDHFHLTGGLKETEIHVRHLERVPLGTSYPEIVERVRKLCSSLGWINELVIDATGVGRPIVDLFRTTPNAGVIAVTITGGTESQKTKVRGGEDWKLPKTDLVGTLVALLHAKRLVIAKELQLTQTLVDELLSYEVKITASANETYNARSGAHDDLVLATALASWHALKPPRRKIQWHHKPAWM